MLQVIDFLQSNAYLLAISIVIGSIVAAFAVGLITNRVLLRLARKTSTMVDDEIIEAIDRPLFLSVVLIGVSLALNRVEISESVNGTIDTVLITLAILLWTQAGMRIGESIDHAVYHTAKGLD